MALSWRVFLVVSGKYVGTDIGEPVFQVRAGVAVSGADLDSRDLRGGLAPAEDAVIRLVQAIQPHEAVIQSCWISAGARDRNDEDETVSTALPGLPQGGP